MGVGLNGLHALKTVTEVSILLQFGFGVDTGNMTASTTSHVKHARQ